MKFSRILVPILLLAALTLCLFSCDENKNDISYDGDGFVATVVEVGEGYLIVKPADMNAPEARSSDRFSVPNYFANPVKKGDTVIIKHDGMIQESYPASFHKIFEMTHACESGMYETVTID